MTPGEAFSGGVAVVTGAGSGIGEGLARAAAALGMKVVLADISADRIGRVAAEIRAAGGTARPVVTDVASPASVDALAAATHGQLGDVRLLVNNAGVDVVGCSWEIAAATWERTLRVNVLGMIHGLRAFVPRMIQRGAPAYIANLSSIGGISMMAWEAPYIVSKHAVLSLSECLCLELQTVAPHVHVSAILPGAVKTRILEDARRADEGSGPVAHHATLMKQMLADNGMTPAAAADLILAGIAAGNFWVSTHPELTTQMAALRARYLTTQSMPSMTTEILSNVD